MSELASALAAPLDGVRTVAVMDREGDAVEVFAEWRSLGGGIDLPVRARRDPEPRQEEAQPVRADAARPGPRARRRLRRADVCPEFGGGATAKDAREASCELRWKSQEVPAPAKKRGRFGSEPFRLAAARVAENADPADGSKPLEWFLPATLPVADEKQAGEALRLYGLCRRETPELAAECFFSDIEIAALADFAKERRFGGPENLGRALGLVASMGGRLHRKYDRPPGSEVVWRGYVRLADSSAAGERARRLGAESEMYKLLRLD